MKNVKTWKLVTCWGEPTENENPESAAPLGFTELYSEFELIVRLPSALRFVSLLPFRRQSPKPELELNV